MKPLPPGLLPQPALRGARPYHVPRAAAPTDLKLDGNEGAVPSSALFDAVGDVEVLRAYPDASGLEAALAARVGVTPDRVIVTAGADEAIDRVCRVAISPDRAEVVLPEPTFEMIHRYARLAGGKIVGVPWRGAWPREDVLARVGPETALVFLVSPNNPTGAVVTRADIDAVAATGVLTVVDHAYVEFADDDLTAHALTHPNVVVLRTLSKAWGLAGLRIGYAIGHPEVIGWMRAGGAPYPVTGLSVALALASLTAGDGEVRRFVAAVRDERESLADALRALGAAVEPSQSNFVFARLADPLWLRDGMAGLGIAIRAFPGKPGLEDAVRITLPGREDALDRVIRGLEAVLAPEAILADPELVEALPAKTRLPVWALAPAGPTHPVADALAHHHLARAWVLTRRPEVVRAARQRAVVPIGFALPDSPEAHALTAAGAARIVASPAHLPEVAR